MIERKSIGSQREKYNRHAKFISGTRRRKSSIFKKDDSELAGECIGASTSQQREWDQAIEAAATPATTDRYNAKSTTAIIIECANKLSIIRLVSRLPTSEADASLSGATQPRPPAATTAWCEQWSNKPIQSATTSQIIARCWPTTITETNNFRRLSYQALQELFRRGLLHGADVCCWQSQSWK